MTTLSNVILQGLHSNIPAAGIPGRMYYETDTYKMFRDNGTSWDDVEANQTPINGWISSASMVYASSDAPSYVVTMSGEQNGIYQAGQKIKITHDSSTKYFIVTKVEVSGSTALTLYGGTDYVLSASAITNPYYSLMKAPFGFTLDPSKWTIEVTDNQIGTQATPTQNIWYNVNNKSINIPIGCWKVYYRAAPQFSDTVQQSWYAETTLSTGNNTESDEEFTNYIGGGSLAYLYVSMTIEKFLSLNSKTAYYLNVRTTATGVDNIYIRGDIAKTIIRAVCAYL